MYPSSGDLMPSLQDVPNQRLQADVVIVGAGIAGLGLACALAPYDLRVLLIERRRETGGPSSRRSLHSRPRSER